MDFQKKRIQFVLFIAGIIILSITAEKCRQLVGEEASSQSGKFTFLNCFDGSSGTLACAVKEGVKLYFYNLRTSHVELARHKAIETALVDAISQGLNAQDAAKQAQKEGVKAAKLATRKAKRIIGPIISSGWDFFEAIYYGGTMTEGFLRGTGTLFGAYGVGFLGEERFGRFGYLVGSHFGSWIGGRIGLMVYDVVNGVHFLLQSTEREENVFSQSPSESEDGSTVTASPLELEEESIYSRIISGIFSNSPSDSKDANILYRILSGIFSETPSDSKDYDTSENSKPSEDSYAYETPTYTMSLDDSGDSNEYQTPTYENSEAHEEF